MQTSAVPLSEDTVDRLAAMSQGAHRLGMSFLDRAETETDAAEKRATTDMFLRCFLAFRLGAKLTMSLMDPPAPARVQREASEREPSERETDSDRERDHERDRDYEPVSLPRFLQTLGVVAADAERHAERLPPEIRNETLPELRRLLADPPAAPPAIPAAGAALLARPQPKPNARARLLGSASAPIGLPGLPKRRQDSS